MKKGLGGFIRVQSCVIRTGILATSIYLHMSFKSAYGIRSSNFD